MNIFIELESQSPESDSFYLLELADLVEQECEVSPHKIKEELGPGVKDSGITIGLTLLGLSISAVGTIISALSYWASEQPKGSVSVTRGDTTVVISNLKPEQLPHILAQLEAENSSDVRILVKRDGNDD